MIVDDATVLAFLEYEEQDDNLIFSIEFDTLDEIKSMLKDSGDSNVFSGISSADIVEGKITIKMVTSKSFEMIGYGLEMDLYDEKGENFFMQMELTINASGEEVVIDFPDFSKYMEY